MYRKRGWLCLSAALVLGLSGFGCRSDQSQAAGVTSQFLDDINGGQSQAARSLLTKAAQQKWTQDLKRSEKESYRLGDPTVTGDDASVPVTITESKGDTTALNMKLRREDGQWRVYAMEFPGGETSITINFEHPEAIVTDLMRAAGQQFGEGMKSFGKGLQAFGEGFQNGIKESPDHNTGSTVTR